MALKSPPKILLTWSGLSEQTKKAGSIDSSFSKSTMARNFPQTVHRNTFGKASFKAFSESGSPAGTNSG